MSREYKTFLATAKSAAGPEFEEAFLRGMRLHHRQGLTESKLCQQRASRTELKDFCGELTSELQRDTRRIGKFICEWYRDCLGADEARRHQVLSTDCGVRLSRYRAVSQSPAMTSAMLMSDTARPFLRTSRSLSAATPV